MSSAMFRLLSLVTAVALLMSIEGSTVKSVATFDAFTRIEAEDFNYGYPLTCNDCDNLPGMVFICYIYTGTVAGYYNVDFANGAVKVNFHMDCWPDGTDYGTVDLRLDTYQSDPFATLDLRSCGGGCSFTMLSTFVKKIPTGIHSVFIYFYTTVPGKSFVADIDWFQFDATSGGQARFDAFQIIEAEDFSYTEVAGPAVCSSSSVNYMGYIKANTVIGYYGVNFGSGPLTVQLRIASWDHGSINLHLDSYLSQPMVTIPIQEADPDVDSCNFVILEQFVSTIPTGVHDLYITVQLASGVTDFVDIDWFTFKTYS